MPHLLGEPGMEIGRWCILLRESAMEIGAPSRRRGRWLVEGEGVRRAAMAEVVVVARDELGGAGVEPGGG